MKGLTEKMAMIHVSEGGDKIFVSKDKDKMSRKKTLMFVIREENGDCSKPINRPFAKIQPENLQFLKDYGESITEKDVNMLSVYFTKNFGSIPKTENTEKPSTTEIFETIYTLCKELDVYQEGGYYHITTKDFDTIAEACNCTSTEIRSLLNRNDMLLLSKSNPHGYLNRKRIPNETGAKPSVRVTSISVKKLEHEIEEDIKNERLLGVI